LAFIQIFRSRRRDEAKSEITNEIDPAAKKQARIKARQEAEAHSFEALGEEYIAEREKEGLSSATIGKSRWLMSLLVPHIGKKPISGIKPAELLTALEVIQDKGLARNLVLMSSRAATTDQRTFRGNFCRLRIESPL